MHFSLNYGNILLAVDTTAYAPVAQLDRVSDYESEGRGFESLPARQTPTLFCVGVFLRNKTKAERLLLCLRINYGSIIKVGVRTKRAYKNKSKKVEHICKKTFKMKVQTNHFKEKQICSTNILQKKYSDCKAF